MKKANKKIDKRIIKKLNKMNSLNCSNEYDEERKNYNRGAIEYKKHIESCLDYMIKVGEVQSGIEKAFAKAKVTHLTNIINSMKATLSKIGNLGKNNFINNL